MKLYFFSVTKHQYSYFKLLKENLSYNSKHSFFPSLSFTLNAPQIQTNDIYTQKLIELDAKYKNRIYKKLYSLLLQVQIPWLTAMLYKKLSAFKPDYLVVWNGKKFHQALAVRVAEHLNIQTIYFENGLLPNTTTMDFKGVNASNSLPREAGFYEAYTIDINKNLPQELVPRIAKTKKKQFNTPLPHTYIFVPFQVAYDTQILQHSPWLKDMFALYTTLESVAQQTNIHFVIKEHPSDRVSNYSQLHAKNNPHILFSSESTQTLIKNATAVLTINSSVALESLLLGKRVIVLGEAFFAIEGIVKTAKSADEIISIIQTIERWKPNSQLIDKFIHYLYFEYLLVDSWQKPTQTHYNAIKQRLEELAC